MIARRKFRQAPVSIIRPKTAVVQTHTERSDYYHLTVGLMLYCQ